MKRKKTVRWDVIKQSANEWLRKDGLTDDARNAIHQFVRDLMYDTESGQYDGFNYVDWLEGGCDKWFADGEPDFPEKTKYFGNETKVKFY